MKKLLLINLVLYTFLNFFNYEFVIEPHYQSSNDSINIWLNKAKDKSNSIDIRRSLLDKSYNKLLQNNLTTDRVKVLSDISYQTLLTRDTAKFYQRNEKVIELASQLKDSFALGDAYWNYATLEVRSNNYEVAFGYFQRAQLYFRSFPYYVAKMLIGKAFIKGRYLDNVGKEKDLVQAIRIFSSLKKYNDLASAYNSLAIAVKELDQLTKSLEYLDKALEYDQKGDKRYEIDIQVNQASTLEEMGKLSESLKISTKLFSHIDESQSPLDYARLLDNHNYTRFLNNDTTGVKKAFYRSLKIRDSLDNKEGVLLAKLHLSKYFQRLHDTVNALKYATEANQLAKKLKNSKNILKTYKMLSVLDSQRSDSYLNKYIQYSDSLVSQERSFRNKLARIELDTDSYIEENEQLAEEKTWIIVISIAVITLLISLYNLILQRRKTEKLVLEKEQEELNKELYQLSIDQQKRIQLEKSEEQKRISEELHDGVLGKLFGTRLGLGFLDVKLKKEEKLKFDNFIEDLQIIEKEIRDVSHQLNSSSENYTADFINLIKELLIEKSRIGDFEYQFNEESMDWNTINENIKLNCYRILQEGLSNIIKHAKATKVELTVKSKNNTLSILLSDNGAGFQTSSGKNGIGLKNIQSRVKKCKGRLTIESTENKGTQLSIEIPIKK